MSYLNKCTALMIFLSPYSMADTLPDMLLTCAKNDNNLLRLACYDKLAKKIDIPVKPIKVAANNTLPVETAIKKAEFGLENRQREENKTQQIEQIQANIIKVKKSPYGHQIITLDNGQVWRQTDSTRLKLAKENTIHIKRGALGSFFIGKENSNKRIRAKRVK